MSRRRKYASLSEVKTREYRAWVKMKERCAHHPRYIGIEVCDRWLSSYEDFLIDMGRKPTSRHTLERVNNLEGYSPDNCKWATYGEQERNRRDSHKITFCGQTLNAIEWDRKFNLPITARLRIGWSMEKAITTPLETKKQRRDLMRRIALEHWRKIKKEEAITV